MSLTACEDYEGSSSEGGEDSDGYYDYESENGEEE